MRFNLRDAVIDAQRTLRASTNPRTVMGKDIPAPESKADKDDLYDRLDRRFKSVGRSVSQGLQPMKAITLYQPWAILWVRGIKVHETRSWPTKHRGPLLVHAGLSFSMAGVSSALSHVCQHYLGSGWENELKLGAVIGMVEIDGCYRVGVDKEAVPATVADREAGDWRPLRYVFHAKTFRQFDKPISRRGFQRFFEVPDELLP